MSLTLYTWKNFSKKKNSTKQPTSTAYTYAVNLKDGTTVDTPTFLLSGDSTVLNINYCRLNDRYYYVDNITREFTGQYELECTTDYLATYKTNIGSYTAFVERASAEYDNYINDECISMSQNYDIDEVSAAITFPEYSGATSPGCYVLRVVGAQGLSSAQLGNSMGIVSYLVPTWDLLRVLDFIFTDSNFNDVITDASVKAFFNPFQYIVDLIWMPYDLYLFYTAHSSEMVSNDIRLGWWNTHISAYVMPDINIEWSGQIPVMNRKYNDFRDFNSDWTKVKIYAPLVGNFEIAAIDYYIGTPYYHYYFDATLGDGLFTVTDGSGKDNVIFQQSIKMGAKVQIGQVATDFKNVIGNSAGALAAAASGNFLASATAAVSAVVNVVQPTPTVTGQAQSIVNYRYTMNITVVRYCAKSGEKTLNVYGLPLYKNRQISTIAGFIKCAAASIDIDGLGGDKDAVNAALNGGFYYE